MFHICFICNYTDVHLYYWLNHVARGYIVILRILFKRRWGTNTLTLLFSCLCFSFQPNTHVFSWEIQVPRMKKNSVVKSCTLALWQSGKVCRNTFTSLTPPLWVVHKDTQMYTLNYLPSDLSCHLSPLGNCVFLSFTTVQWGAFVGVRVQLWCAQG